MTNYTDLQKRCQRGCVALSNANNLLAECYAAIGDLSAKLECARGDLRQAMKIIESSGAIEVIEPSAEISTIDWSKAPDGALAAYPGCKQMYQAWYRLDQYGYVEQICESAGCSKWTNMGGRIDFPFGAQLRPASE